MLGSSLGAWHPSAGGLDMAGLPSGVELGLVGINKSVFAFRDMLRGEMMK